MGERECAKKCESSDCELVWRIPYGDCFTKSSANLEDWPICHDCMVEHCVSTNCLSCSYGKYPDCQFLSLKRYYMNND